LPISIGTSEARGFKGCQAKVEQGVFLYVCEFTSAF